MQVNKSNILPYYPQTRIRFVGCVLFFIFLFSLGINQVSAKPKPRNYYLSAKGSDANTGLTPAKPWRTMRPIANITIVPGDSFLFHGGDTFPGCLTLWNSDSGTPSQPLVFTTYGTGKAHINAGDSFGFFIFNVGGVTFKNLDIYGSGNSDGTAGNGNGLEFFTNDLKGHKYKYIRVEDVDLHGFASTGLSLGSQNSSYSGFQDIRITGTNFYENKKNGMVIYDLAEQSSTLYSHAKLYIGNCVAFKNGVTGIVVGGVDSGVIEKCRSSYTGSSATNGVSIMVSSSRYVTVQYCISDHIIANGPDGEGFDLDGGTVHCIIQYCYAFQNYGYGYMFCDYPHARRTHNNIIRYNISENDARKPMDYQSSFLFNSWGTGLDSCYMYNNTAYNSDNGNYPVSGLLALALVMVDSTAHFTHCFAFNNNVYLSGKNNNDFVNMYSGNYPIADSNILFMGNNYYSTTKNSKRWQNNSNVYYNLKDWQDAEKQEIVGSTRYGTTINPSFLNAGKGGTMLDPDSLRFLNAYTLNSGSSLTGSGINIDSLLPFKNVPFDFYRDTLYPLHVATPGADEPQPIHFAPIPRFAFSNACLGDTVHFKDSSLHALGYFWDFGDTASARKGLDSSIKASPMHLYNAPGVYTVKLRLGSLYDKTDSIVKIITIYDKPSANWTWTNNASRYDFKASDSTLSFYRWNFDDSTAYVDSMEAHHSFLHPGKFNVSLEVKNTFGCDSRKTDSIFINFTGLEKTNNAALFQLYPNPVTSVLNVEAPQVRDAILTVLNATGTIVMVVKLNERVQLDISSLPKGIYFVRVQTKDNISVQKLVKE